MEEQDQCEKTYKYIDSMGDLNIAWGGCADDKPVGPGPPEAPKKEVRKDMMGLYDVYVVDTKKGQVIIHNEIVAKDEDKAKIRVAMGHTTDIPDSIEFFVRCIGTWEDKKPKEVKIVKE